MFFKIRGVYISNTFNLFWKNFITFQILHMEDGINIEAKGLVFPMRGPFEPNNNPIISADSLILKERKIENPYTALENLREVIKN